MKGIKSLTFAEYKLYKVLYRIEVISASDLEVRVRIYAK